MKPCIFCLVAFALATCLSALAAAPPAAMSQEAGAAPSQDGTAVSSDGGNGVLVAYFSRGGNTRALAELIHAQVGGELFEIRTNPLYPADYDKALDQAKAEQAAGARPALAANVPDMSKYTVVILGYPNWWADLPMPVYTFVETHDLAGKTVLPFCTHDGSGLSRTVASLESKLPGAKVLPGLAVRGRRAASSGDEAAEWLRKSGVALKATGQ